MYVMTAPARIIPWYAAPWIRWTPIIVGAIAIWAAFTFVY